MEEVEVYEMVLSDEVDDYGLSAYSLVERPAIQENFVALSEQSDLVMLKEADKEKRLLIGAALIPNIKIARVDKDGKPYMIYFSEQTIETAAHRYLMEGMQNNATLEHDEMVLGVHLVEQWIVEDPDRDKTAVHGLRYPKGTLAVALKVKNDEVWNEWVKSGKVKGFSIEGRFIHRPKVALSEVQQISNDIQRAIDGMVESK